MYTFEQVRIGVKKTIAEMLGLISSEIRMQDDLMGDLQIDDIDLEVLVCALESEFSVNLDYLEEDNVCTVEELVEYIYKNCNIV